MPWSASVFPSLKIVLSRLAQMHPMWRLFHSMTIAKPCYFTLTLCHSVTTAVHVMSAPEAIHSSSVRQSPAGHAAALCPVPPGACGNRLQVWGLVATNHRMSIGVQFTKLGMVGSGTCKVFACVPVGSLAGYAKQDSRKFNPPSQRKTNHIFSPL